MKDVIMYTTPICGYCAAAKRLLSGKGVSYTEINVMSDPDKRQEMIQKAGGRQTVPQIFVGDQHIGGFDDMNALERSGKFDQILAG